MTREQENYIANNREITPEPTTTGQPKMSKKIAVATTLALVAGLGLHANTTTHDDRTIEARSGFSKAFAKIPGQKPYPRPRG
ncbi:hypothetical protein [Rothia amarae]|uniref:hypothetical protein n=1 Tax=Rothia amarae TaxID=169480 RepID=UPI0031CFF9EE